MKSTSKLGSMIFRKDPELTVSFHDGNILDTEVDAIVLSTSKDLLINEEIYEDLVERGNYSSIMEEVRVFDRNSSVINDFMAMFELEVDTPEVRPNDSSILKSIPHEQVHDDACVICLGELSDKSDFVVAIKKCNHMFHRNCFESYSNQVIVKRCPTCQVFFALPEGDMPRGSTMTHNVITDDDFDLEGGHGYISISYSIPGGIQAATHLRPGVPFHGTHREAYLPNTPEGHKVLKLLQKAFECRLTFTVGDSITTGAQNVVVWNNIHHKTNLDGGSAWFGYPDPDYLLRVTEELRAAGIIEDMINV